MKLKNFLKDFNAAGKKKKKEKKKEGRTNASTLQHYMALLLEDIRDGKRTAQRPENFFDTK